MMSRTAPLARHARRGLFAQAEADGASADSGSRFGQLELYQQLMQQHFMAGYLQPGGHWYQSANFGAAGVQSYSNAGAELANLALEQLTAKPFAQWSAREILASLQRQNTFWLQQDIRHAATLYVPTPAGCKAVPAWPELISHA